MKDQENDEITINNQEDLKTSFIINWEKKILKFYVHFGTKIKIKLKK